MGNLRTPAQLYTKAYSLLKEQSQGSSRVALSVAFRIAETYASSSQHELAMRYVPSLSLLVQTTVYLTKTASLRAYRRLSRRISGRLSSARSASCGTSAPRSLVASKSPLGFCSK